MFLDERADVFADVRDADAVFVVLPDIEESLRLLLFKLALFILYYQF
jgi:hypothetical protein